jgi:hypothetical protein
MTTKKVAKKKKEKKYDAKDSVKIAQRTNYSLAVFYLIIAVFVYFIDSSQVNGSITLIALAMLLLVSGYFISNYKIIGVYLGWLFVVLGCAVSLYNEAILGLFLSANVGYWNYKAQEKIRLKK